MKSVTGEKIHNLQSGGGRGNRKFELESWFMLKEIRNEIKRVMLSGQDSN